MLSCRSERKPCCGPKSAASVTSSSDSRRSAAWRKAASTDAGLQTRPTRLPAINPRSLSRSWSTPSETTSGVAPVEVDMPAIIDRPAGCRERRTRWRDRTSSAQRLGKAVEAEAVRRVARSWSTSRTSRSVCDLPSQSPARERWWLGRRRRRSPAVPVSITRPAGCAGSSGSDAGALKWQASDPTTR